MNEIFSYLINDHELVINLKGSFGGNGFWVKNCVIYFNYAYENANKKLKRLEFFEKLIANVLYKNYSLRLHKDYEFSKETFILLDKGTSSYNGYFFKAFASIILTKKCLNLLKLKHPEIFETLERSQPSEALRAKCISNGFYGCNQASVGFNTMDKDFDEWLPDKTWKEIYEYAKKEVDAELAVNVYD